MDWLDELFGGKALTYEDFSSALEKSGKKLGDISGGDFIPASREAELLGEIESLKSHFEEQVQAVRAEAALKSELIRQGAYNPEAAAAIIVKDGIQWDSNDIKSEVAARVEALKSSDSYLFHSSGDSFSTGAAHAAASVDTDSMSDSEYYRHIRLK